jgi:hypothetical protein
VAQAPPYSWGLSIDGGTVLTGVGFMVGLVAEVLKFNIEVVGTEEIEQAQKRGTRVVISAGIDEGADLSLSAAGEANETLGVGTKRLEGHQRGAFAFRVGQVGGGKEAA